MTEQKIKAKRKANIEALEDFYGIEFVYDEQRREYVGYSPTGRKLMTWGTIGAESLFGCGGGELLPPEIRDELDKE